MSFGLTIVVLYLVLVILQLLLLYVLSRYANRALFHLVGKTFYLLLAIPGTVMHELSHYIGCLLTNTRVTEFHPFSPQREGDRFILGYVRHAAPRGPVSALVIGTAPFWGGAFTLWLASAVLIPAPIETLLGPFSSAGPVAVLSSCVVVVSWLASSLMNLEWQSFLLVYLLISIPSHMAPSREDLRNTAWSIIIAAVISVLLVSIAAYTRLSIPNEIFGLVVGFLSILSGLLTFSLFMTIIVSLVVVVVSRLAGRSG
jgi:hypothetical protein